MSDGISVAKGKFARQQSRAAPVRFGSKADIHLIRWSRQRDLPGRHLRQVEHYQLIGCTPVAGSKGTTYEVSAIGNYITAETVSPVRHRRQSCPAVSFGIEGFVFGKGMVRR